MSESDKVIAPAESENVTIPSEQKEDTFNLKAFQRLKLNEKKIMNMDQALVDLCKCWDRSNNYIIRHDQGLQIAAETQAKHFQKLNDLNIRLGALQDSVNGIQSNSCCCCSQNADLLEKIEKLNEKDEKLTCLTLDFIAHSSGKLDQIDNLVSQLYNINENLEEFKLNSREDSRLDSQRVYEVEYKMDMKTSALQITCNHLNEKCGTMCESILKRKGEIETLQATVDMKKDEDGHLHEHYCSKINTLERTLSGLKNLLGAERQGWIKEINDSEANHRSIIKGLEEKVGIQSRQLLLQDEAIKSIYAFLGVEQSVIVTKSNGETKEIGGYETVSKKIGGIRIMTDEEVKQFDEM